jgi:hypothetical protein
MQIELSSLLKSARRGSWTEISLYHQALFTPVSVLPWRRSFWMSVAKTHSRAMTS